MAYIKPKKKNESPYVFIVKGALYRIQVKVWNYEEHDFLSETKSTNDGLNVVCHSLEQSYHKNTAYWIAGDLIYNGISLKEAWEEVRLHVGNVEIPEELKELQPFITQQL